MRGNNLKTSFSFMGQNVKKKLYFGAILGALRGSSMIRLGLSCFPAILSPISMYSEIRKQSDKKFLSLNPKYEKKLYFFHIWATIYKMCIFGYSGGSGWPINNRTGPIYPLTYINLHIKYGSNPIRFF